MVKVKAAVLAIALSFCCTPAPAAPAYEIDPHVAVVEQILQFKDPRVSVIIDWQACDMVNAAYSPSTRHITICLETISKRPELLPFFMAHELGHATIDQLDLPITGSEEVAADEYATYTLIRAGMFEDVEAAAHAFWERGADIPFDDPHPDDDVRGYMAHCYVRGWLLYNGFPKPMHSQCVSEYRRLVHTWTRFLKRD